MSKLIRNAVILAIAMWQVEMAVEAAVVTLPRRRAARKPQTVVIQAAPTTCTGTSCRLPQQPSSLAPTTIRMAK